MTPEDVIDILTAIAVTDRRTVSGNEVTMWHKIIGDLPKDLALQAVVDHFRERPGVWLEPGHIVAGVRAIRQDRAMRQRLSASKRTTTTASVSTSAPSRDARVSKIGRHDQPRALGPRGCSASTARPRQGAAASSPPPADVDSPRITTTRASKPRRTKLTGTEKF